jgi:enoyl-CoA hydratase/carnithine racemase
LWGVLDAAEAQRAGLVSRVLPNATFAADAMALSRTLASRGPIGLRYAKEAIHQGLDMPLDQALRLELDFSIILQTTQDRAEGVNAFMEKRPPNFEGR